MWKVQNIVDLTCDVPTQTVFSFLTPISITQMVTPKLYTKNIYNSSVYDCTVEDVENRRTYATSISDRANVI